MRIRTRDEDGNLKPFEQVGTYKPTDSDKMKTRLNSAENILTRLLQIALTRGDITQAEFDQLTRKS